MKIDRLIGVLSVLLQEEKTTAPELAERFEVSRRTINRDIEDLCKAGIPIRTVTGDRRRHQYHGRISDGSDDPDIKGYADDPCGFEESGQCERKQLLRAADGKDPGGIL